MQSMKKKLTKVLSDTKSQMMDAGLVWREVKCAVLHLKRGKVVDKDGDISWASFEGKVGVGPISEQCQWKLPVR